MIRMENSGMIFWKETSIKKCKSLQLVSRQL